MGDESIMPPPASKNALSTWTRTSRADLSSPTLNVSHDPMPMTGSGSPVFGMALVNGVVAAVDLEGRVDRTVAPTAAMEAKKARRVRCRVLCFITRLRGSVRFSLRSFRCTSRSRPSAEGLRTSGRDPLRT